MNIKLFFAASVLTFSGVLAACGSDEATETVQKENVAEETEENSVETEKENPAASNGVLTVSESQSYAVYLLPDYDLTAEEPGKDIIYWTENDELFMRVETFKPEETDFKFAEESMKETLMASGKDAELTELPAFKDVEFKSSSLYETSTENGKVTGIAFEKEGLIVKLTIFDQTDATITNEFVNMGKTISAK